MRKINTRKSLRLQRLDQFTLDIEFLLISVVQGVALAVLAGIAAEPISKLQFETWPYIITGFLFILIFWSQAIVHAISIISWPLDLTHNFIYFLASFVEVLTFDHLQNPLMWFIYSALFLIVGWVLYIVDLKLIKSKKEKFMVTNAKIKLYKHILSRQIFEFKYFIIAGIGFNLLSAFLIYQNPVFFIDHKGHLILAIIQLGFGIITIINLMKSFSKRMSLVTNAS